MNSTVETQSDLTKLRIRVAELCPDLFVHVPSPFGPGNTHWATGKDDNGNVVKPGAVIDLLNDLNACHEFEKLLDQQQFNHYCAELGHLTSHDAAYCSVNAPAPYRCRAFVTVSFARRLGASWAGGSDEEAPERLDAAIIFAPIGALVPAALKNVKRGGTVVCGGPLNVNAAIHTHSDSIAARTGRILRIAISVFLVAKRRCNSGSAASVTPKQRKCDLSMKTNENQP